MITVAWFALAAVLATAGLMLLALDRQKRAHDPLASTLTASHPENNTPEVGGFGEAHRATQTPDWPSSPRPGWRPVRGPYRPRPRLIGAGLGLLAVARRRAHRSGGGGAGEAIPGLLAPERENDHE